MTFSEAEKAAISSLAAKISANAEDFGADALYRMFLSFPQTKTYFSHFDLSQGSKDLRSHGGKIVKAIGNAAQHVDDLDHALSSLSDLHAQKLKVDPANFKKLSQAIQVGLSAHFPGEFTPVAQGAWDKFLASVSSVLVSKYR
ncbi:hemoglobin subunit alpha-5-like [Dendrobates tinctorius]|uniref:hemoglobin subunit alpha-5-like n=1 Tax=Dendrobates tinctorius TaxID=92724 RepID=UPI003CC9DEDA